MLNKTYHSDDLQLDVSTPQKLIESAHTLTKRRIMHDYGTINLKDPVIGGPYGKYQAYFHYELETLQEVRIMLNKHKNTI